MPIQVQGHRLLMRGRERDAFAIYSKLVGLQETPAPQGVRVGSIFLSVLVIRIGLLHSCLKMVKLVLAS